MGVVEIKYSVIKTLFCLPRKIEEGQADLKWPIYPTHFVRVVLYVENYLFNSERVFSLTNTYLVSLCIINYIPSVILPKLLQENQMTHVSEKFWIEESNYELRISSLASY